MERGERCIYGLGKQMTGRNNNQTDEGGETGTERGESTCYREREEISFFTK